MPDVDKARHAPVNQRLVSWADPRSFEAEQYRRLRHRVEELGISRPLRVIAVTSPIGGDGKTLTALNLAGALAQRPSAKVLVIDADLHQPSVATQLGLGTDEGVAAFLRSSNGRLEDFTKPMAGMNLTVLPCAGDCDDAYELLTSPRFAELLGSARAQYDYVIVDTPPLILVSDGALIRSVVDGYIIVVSANTTPRKLVGETLNLLGAQSVVGLVFNREDRPLFDDYGGYYSSYFRPSSRSAGGATKAAVPPATARAHRGGHSSFDHLLRSVRAATEVWASRRPTGRWADVALSGLAQTIRFVTATVSKIPGLLAAWRPAAVPGSSALTGVVTLTSEPVGARVRIDSVDRGVTPLKLSVPAGQHVIEMAVAGSKRSFPLLLDGGSVVMQHVEFVPPAAPPGVRVAIDDRSMGATPASIPAPSVEDHPRTSSREAPSLQRADTISEAAANVTARRPSADGAEGWAQINSPIDLQVFVRGQLVGTVPGSGFTLPVGWHDLELVNTGFGFRSSLRLEIESGKTSSKTVAVPNGSIFVNVRPWAEVMIDGQLVGTTPLGVLSLPIGNHEVILRHPELGQRKETVSVRTGNPVRLDVEFRT